MKECMLEKCYLMKKTFLKKNVVKREPFFRPFSLSLLSLAWSLKFINPYKNIAINCDARENGASDKGLICMNAAS